MSLIHFDNARRELRLATDIDEVKTIRDKAEALRLYARQAGESLEMQNQVAEIKIRAERRAGELLKEREKATGTRGQIAGATAGRGSTPTLRPAGSCKLQPPAEKPPPTLKDLGIEKTQAHRWQRTADVPEEVFEEHIAETKAKGEELTSASVQRLAKELDRKKKKASASKTEWPKGTYRVLYADRMQRRIVGSSSISSAVLGFFALRSTNPAALATADDPVGPSNDDTIIARAKGVDKIICAWGAHGSLNQRDFAVMNLLRRARLKPWCLGTTKDGHPRHPLYLQKDTPLERFNVEAFA